MRINLKRMFFMPKDTLGFDFNKIRIHGVPSRGFYRRRFQPCKAYFYTRFN